MTADPVVGATISCENVTGATGSFFEVLFGSTIEHALDRESALYTHRWQRTGDSKEDYRLWEKSLTTFCDEHNVTFTNTSLKDDFILTKKAVQSYLETSTPPKTKSEHRAPVHEKGGDHRVEAERWNPTRLESNS